jgi:hypothetical protein
MYFGLRNFNLFLSIFCDFPATARDFLRRNELLAESTGTVSSSACRKRQEKLTLFVFYVFMR